MIHAFRLGPLPSPDGTSRHAYVGLVEGGEPVIQEASSDRAGLEALKAGAFGELACEPALADAGRPLGLETAPLPEKILATRAVLAFELASGIQHGASKPAAIAAFLRGAAAFWAARSWEVVGPEERLRVAFLEGHAEVDGELSVVGGDGMRLPGVALCDARDALGELARLEGDARAEAVLRLANLTVDMERDPAWAAEALEDGYGLGRLPVASRKRDGREAPMVTQDLLVAAALLEAIAAWTKLEEEGAVGEGTAEIAGMKVVARVRESGRLAPGPAEGLTPVGAAAAAPAPEPAPASPAVTPPTPAPESASAAAPVAPAAPQPAAATATATATATTPPPRVPVPEAAAPVPTPAATPPRQEPAAAPRASQPTPAEPEPTPELEPRPGWLARAWRSLRRDRAEPAEADAPAAPEPPAPQRSPRPAPPRASRPPPVTARPPADAVAEAAGAVEDGDPFAPFARALRIPIPAEPPAPTDEAALAELSARLIEAAKAAAGELVSFPAVAVQIVERVHDPRADARAVAGFIARDPALAADVVSVANSAAFRGVSEIESVHEAVARLGLGEVGRVASAVAARKILDPQGKGGARPTTGLFVRAVAVATAAAGAALRQRGARSDHVWLGGLLHDVGKVLAMQLMARLAAEPGAHLTPIALGDRTAERVHVEVGEAAIRQWGLPAYLLEICGHHHDAIVPAEAVDLHLVRLTSALASLADPDLAARAAREIVQSAAALRMPAAAVRALATDLKAAEERARALVR